MNPLIQCKTTILPLLIAAILGCFALSQVAEAGPAPAANSNPQTVTVVNTTSNPVPTSATGTTTVAGTVTAAQGGTWIVGVNNTTASPVPFRDVDNPATQAFEAEAVGGFADGASTTGDITIATVPAGKRLVIEHVSVLGKMNTGQRLVRVNFRKASGLKTETEVKEVGTDANGSTDYFVVSEALRTYANPGLLQCFAERDSFAGNNPNSVTFTISGYFVDCPTCVP